MKQSTTKWEISSANKIMLELKEEVQSIGLDPLGPSFKTMSGPQCVDSLVVHRIIKKFEKPEKSSTRSATSVAAMLEYDREGLTTFNPARMPLDPYVRQTLYQARNTLHEVLSTFHISYHCLELPSGESYDSAKGDTSIFAKLKNRCNWKVTPSCFEFFCRIVYNNRGLRRAAKAHFRSRSHDFHVRFYNYMKAHHPDPAYQCFRALLKKDVVTFWYGSRLTTVPKNIDTDRVIEVECLGNMICQRCIAGSLRECIKTHFGVDLLNAQDLHKSMICDHENATIDWKNASNSNWRCLMQWFYPKKVFRLLDDSRAAVVSYTGEYNGLNMLSPMGNGYTFEVMTLFLLTIARTLDSFSMVFGDDVIIHQDCAEDYIRVVEACGWHVNESKTFIDGKFRESCGGFHHADIGYIRSFDFHWIEDEVDLMVCVNKLHYIIEAKQVSPELSNILTQYHSKLLACCACHAFRPSQTHYESKPQKQLFNKLFYGQYSHEYKTLPIPTQANLEEGVLVSKSRYKRALELLKGLSPFKRHRSNKIFADYQVAPYCIIKVPYKCVKMYQNTPKDSVRSPFWIAYYLYTLRCDPPHKGRKTTVRHRTVAFIPGGSINMDALPIEI